MIEISKECHVCHETHIVRVPAKGYCDWRFDDKLIQNALPELSDNDRELLISGICRECFDKICGNPNKWR